MFNEHPSENFCFSLELFQSYHDFHPPHSRLWESGSPGGESGEKYHDHRGPWRLPRDWPGLAWRSIPWHTGCPWSQGITLLPLRQRPSSIQKLSLTLDWRMYSFKGCPWKAFFDKNTTFFELWTLVGSQLHQVRNSSQESKAVGLFEGGSNSTYSREVCQFAPAGSIEVPYVFYNLLVVMINNYIH